MRVISTKVTALFPAEIEWVFLLRLWLFCLISDFICTVVLAEDVALLGNSPTAEIIRVLLSSDGKKQSDAIKKVFRLTTDVW